MYVASLLVAALVAIASTAGLLFGASGLYRVDRALLPAFLGQDVLNLVVGLPLLLGAMGLTRRGALLGPPLWFGALFYVVYDYAFYALGARVNALFIPYLLIVTVSAYTAVAVAASVDATVIRARLRRLVPERATGGFLVAVASLFIALWSAGIVTAATRGEAPGMVVHSVWTLDLTIQLPALLLGGVLLWRGRALGFVVAPGLLLQAAAYLLGLSAISILGTDPTGGAVTAGDWAPGVVLGAIALALIGSFVRAASASRRAPRVNARIATEATP